MLFLIKKKTATNCFRNHRQSIYSSFINSAENYFRSRSIMVDLLTIRYAASGVYKHIAIINKVAIIKSTNGYWKLNIFVPSKL